MSRIIKFRAWEEEVKVMIYKNDDDFQLLYSDEEMLLMVNDPVHTYNGQEDVEVDNWVQLFGADFMEFIGLEDKDGVDIFENDIIQFKMPNELNDNVIITVEVTKSKYGWHPFTDPLYCMDKALNLTVIGNRFENPQLLYDSNK